MHLALRHDFIDDRVGDTAHRADAPGRGAKNSSSAPIDLVRLRGLMEATRVIRGSAWH
jgi:hypothetical protein